MGKGLRELLSVIEHNKKLQKTTVVTQKTTCLPAARVKQRKTAKNDRKQQRVAALPTDRLV